MSMILKHEISRILISVFLNTCLSQQPKSVHIIKKCLLIICVWAINVTNVYLVKFAINANTCCRLVNLVCLSDWFTCIPLPA